MKRWFEGCKLDDYRVTGNGYRRGTFEGSWNPRQGKADADHDLGRGARASTRSPSAQRRNVANLMTGSGMQQARRAGAEKIAEVVQNHGGET